MIIHNNNYETLSCELPTYIKLTHTQNWNYKGAPASPVFGEQFVSCKRNYKMGCSPIDFHQVIRRGIAQTVKLDFEKVKNRKSITSWKQIWTQLKKTISPAGKYHLRFILCFKVTIRVQTLVFPVKGGVSCHQSNFKMHTAFFFFFNENPHCVC